jgi:hypothetical protein
LEASGICHVEYEDWDQKDGDGYADYDNLCNESDSAVGEEVHAFLLLILVSILRNE